MCIYLRSKFFLQPSLHLRFKRNIRNMGVLKWKNSIIKTHFCRVLQTPKIRNYSSLNDNKAKADLNIHNSCVTLDLDNIDETELVRFTLFDDKNNDSKIKEINACASADDVLKFIEQNSNILSDKYITQIVLVLYDLQVIFSKVSGIGTSQAKTKFLQKLVENKVFNQFIDKIQDSIDNFDPNLLSYSLVYLSLLGIPVETQFIQDMSLKLRNHLKNDFSVKYCSRLFKVIFKENSVRPYYVALDIIPKVFNKIESYTDPEELMHLTTCLNRAHPIVTSYHLETFKTQVNLMIDNKSITEKDTNLVLKILLFLNYPQWREQNSLLISKCILLIKDSIDTLKIGDLELLYDVFFKNQEPGEVLNSIQRSSAKRLQEIEESDYSDIDTKLKFFSSLIYFCSPTHRSKFRKDVVKFLSQCNDLKTLILLKKIFSYLKISDIDMCGKYWDKILETIKKEDTSLENIVDVVNNYMQFYTDIDNYRHYQFEIFIFKFLKQKFKDETISLYPDKFFPLFNFAIANIRNDEILNAFMCKFYELKKQISADDVLKISQTLNMLQYDYRRRISDKHLREIRKILNQVTRDIFEGQQHDFKTVSKLLRGAIYRNATENETFEEMIQTYKNMPFMSSKTMENICYMFLSTSILIPEVINHCTEYVVSNKRNILGFNAEKILFICYSLNYYPVNNGIFFDTVTDIIIRDQERLSALAFVQSVLSLCYFGRVSKSLVKQIFNVEFLEKLDIELMNCYSRDTYPHRVRTALMQLNRAVCLEYPEYHVPWFHQRFVEEKNRYTIKEDLKDIFHLRVKDYLVGVLGKDSVIENIVAPYGYEIDFVIKLDSEKQVLSRYDYTSVATNLAILLWSDLQYTKLYTHLKGKYQMQIRHLEILGYKVKIVKFNEWMNLLYAKERIDFVKNIVFE